MHTRPRFLVSLALALVLLAGACSSSDRPVVTEGTRNPTTAPTEAPTAPAQIECDPDLYCVAEAKTTDAQPIYANPGDSEPVTSIARSYPEQPVVFLVAEDQGDWLKVYLPIRPNGSTGYVKKDDVNLSQHDWHIEVRLADFDLKVFEGDQLFLDAPIAVAADNTPTPGGTFYTTELIKPPDPNSVYGTYAYGLSGYSDTLTTFNGGPGQLGIHGTNRPELVGSKVSHGCIRMTNENIEKLAPVLPLGVPVEIYENVPAGAVVDG
jgi:L,D-transpeptidase catalytic domain